MFKAILKRMSVIHVCVSVCPSVCLSVSWSVRPSVSACLSICLTEGFNIFGTEYLFGASKISDFRTSAAFY